MLWLSDCVRMVLPSVSVCGSVCVTCRVLLVVSFAFAVTRESSAAWTCEVLPSLPARGVPDGPASEWIDRLVRLEAALPPPLLSPELVLVDRLLREWVLSTLLLLDRPAAEPLLLCPLPVDPLPVERACSELPSPAPREAAALRVFEDPVPFAFALLLERG
ncbi:hypothetical protein NRB20_75340 [Nocardia sp. RB20]|uniref:Uncharacterized protein n=1 Tax=Nocardia macrotermitis TaxID=2585198 RepID=A0A7K0DFG8_9NOCA|nr:hypothetical protein [Nocardia macrotermitis]